MKETSDIYDDEIRIIRREQPKTDDQKRTPKWLVIVVIAVAVLLVAIVLWVMLRNKESIHSNGPSEREMEEVETVFDPVDVSENLPSSTWFGDYPDTLVAGYAQRMDTTLGQVALSVYVPYNACPELTIGSLDMDDNTIILAAQAADIRRDNKEILGSFVLAGQKISEGISKTGYCAILDGKIILGVAEDSPLYDEAIARGGYFFRQYPLVQDGKWIENNPKNITKRKALCERQGQVFMVESQTNESFKSFAQALVQLGVDDAIYLVGSHTSYGWWVDQDNKRHFFCDSIKSRTYSNENYIVWKRKAVAE